MPQNTGLWQLTWRRDSQSRIVFPSSEQNNISTIIFWIPGSSVGISGCVQQRAVVGLVTTWLAASDLVKPGHGLCCLLKSFCCRIEEKKGVEMDGTSRSFLPYTSAMQRWLWVSEVSWGNSANLLLLALCQFMKLKKSFQGKKKDDSLTWFKSTDLLLVFNKFCTLLPAGI